MIARSCLIFVVAALVNHSEESSVEFVSSSFPAESITPNMGSEGNGVAAKLARTNILALHPYRCARDDYSSGILLDANENAFGPPFGRTTVAVDNGSDGRTDISSSPEKLMSLERYPDPYQIPLKEKFLQYRQSSVPGQPLNLSPANVFVGVGSDEAIDLLMRIFCIPGGTDTIITTPPTYGMYAVCAKINDVPIVPVPLTPTFDLRTSEVGSMLSA
jgi:histidinol-phosphate aminotransferase